LIRAAGFREVGDIWASVERGGILLCVSCYYAAIVVRVLAWRLLLGEESPSSLALAPPLALGFVLGHLLPAKSGEPASAVLVSRASGVPVAKTLSVLTAERALHLLTLLATFLPAATIYAGEVLEIRRTMFLAWLVLAALVAAAFFAKPLLRSLTAVATRLPRIGSAARDYLEALARKVAPLLGLATLFWLLQYLSLWAILDAGGLSVNLIGSAAVGGAAIIGGTLSMLPLGTQDGISAVVLRGIGVPLAQGFSLALFHTMVSLGCGLVLVLAIPLLARESGE
jgi:uncharacterized membrane protein YbhN (UPF0104 family)